MTTSKRNCWSLTTSLKFATECIETVQFACLIPIVPERATVGIDDSEIEDYRQIVEDVLGELFGLKFKEESGEGIE